jgi:hypothetical protein
VEPHEGCHLGTASQPNQSIESSTGA